MIPDSFARVSTSVKRFLAAAHDVLMSCLAFGLTLGARYGFDFLLTDPRVFWWVALFGAVTGAMFYIFGVGRGIWRFASITDLKTICLASAVSIVVFLIIVFLFNRLDGLPRSLPLLAWINMVFFVGAPRLLYRGLKDGWSKAFFFAGEARQNREDILLVGSAVDADRAIRTYMLEGSSRYHVRGIVETRIGKVGRDVRGIPIIGDILSFETIVEKLRADGILIAAAVMVSPRTDKDALQSIVQSASRLGIALRRVAAANLTTSEPQMDLVTLEDLLGRPSVSLDLASIQALVRDKRVCVTGAGGSIGSEIVRQVAALAPAKIVLVDSSEFNLFSIDTEMARLFPAVERNAILADVRSGVAVRRIFQREKPDIVFHAAALKHVPLVEANVAEGVLTNVIGTRNCVEAALEARVSAFVMISTDKAVRPSSIMGATKRVAELFCQAHDAPSSPTRFITVRFGNVLGSTGSVVPHFKKQIQDGGPITVTHPEMRRYFMVINEATELVLQAAVAGLSRPEEYGRVFVLDMGQPIKIVDLARSMIALSGLRPDEDIQIVYTGVRPGERLFEEIFDARESIMPSGKEGVFIAKAATVDLAALRSGITALEQAAAENNEEKIRLLLAEFVPDLAAQAADDGRGRVVPFNPADHSGKRRA